MTTSVTNGILARLATETRAEHEAIERELDLLDESLTLRRYRHRLEQLHRYHRAIEARLPSVPGLDLHARRKAPLLATDLAALGGDCGRLGACPELPPLGSTAQRFGCLYVLEGATLGGQIISRHLRRALGVTPETGGRFFHGYGKRTGEMWTRFRAALTTFAATTDAHDVIVATAIATFRTLRQWCQREGRLA